MAECIYLSADYCAVSVCMTAGGMMKVAETGNGWAGSTGAKVTDQKPVFHHCYVPLREGARVVGHTVPTGSDLKIEAY